MDPRRAAAIARLVEEARSAGKAIRAYHGSPHSFDRFDASQIGTGEGAQAYGHGLYFAGNEDVAKTYRDQFSGGLYVDGVPLSEAISASGLTESPWYRDIATSLSNGDDLADELDWARRTWQQASEALKSNPRNAGAYQQLADFQGYLDAYNFLSTRNVKQHRGRMYEVELGVPEEALLDYDKPFSTPAGVAGAEVLRQDNPAAVSARALRAIQDGSWRMESFAGRSPYETAATELTRLAKTRRGAKSLLDAGIPGVRYFDAWARGAAEGTRNYVMFPGTEDHIRILRKYGLLAPMALPALQEGE